VHSASPHFSESLSGTEPGFRPDWRQIHRGGGNSYRQNLINACNRFLEQGRRDGRQAAAAFLRICPRVVARRMYLSSDVFTDLNTVLRCIPT
jgi:hypothetical protein